MGRNEGINKRELSSSWCRLVKEEKCSVVKKGHKSGKNAVIKRLNRQTSVFSKWSTAVVQFLSLKGKLSARPYYFFLFIALNCAHARLTAKHFHL